MSVVGGLDIHWKQLTFDYLDQATGKVTSGRIAPADREHLAVWPRRFEGVDQVVFAAEADPIKHEQHRLAPKVGLRTAAGCAARPDLPHPDGRTRQGSPRRDLRRGRPPRRTRLGGDEPADALRHLRHRRAAGRRRPRERERPLSKSTKDTPAAPTPTAQPRGDLPHNPPRRRPAQVNQPAGSRPWQQADHEPRTQPSPTTAASAGEAGLLPPLAGTLWGHSAGLALLVAAGGRCCRSPGSCLARSWVGSGRCCLRVAI
jgi:hypothetical protein